jgi:hypothetical protein
VTGDQRLAAQNGRPAQSENSDRHGKATDFTGDRAVGFVISHGWSSLALWPEAAIRRHCRQFGVVNPFSIP